MLCLLHKGSFDVLGSYPLVFTPVTLLKMFLQLTQSCKTHYFRLQSLQPKNILSWKGPTRSLNPTPGSAQHHPNPMSESSVRAVPTALGRLFRAHHPLGQHLSLPPAAPPLTQLHAVPSGPVAIPRKQSSAPTSSEL